MVSDILGFVFVTAVGLNIFGGIPASIWVIYDYKKLQMYKYKGYDGIITTAIGCLLFCIACLPWYYHKRRAILNGTARLHLHYAKEPPPLYVKPSLPLKDSTEDKLRLMEKDILLSSGTKFSISKLLRAVFLSLNIRHEDTLINALKSGGLSSSAAKLIYAAFHLLAAHYANGRKDILRVCYLVCPPSVPKEENKTEHLLTRLELLAEAGRKGRIKPKTYNKLYLQVASALDDAVILKHVKRKTRNRKILFRMRQ